VSSGAFALAFAVPAFALKSLQNIVEGIAAGDQLVNAAAGTIGPAGVPVKASDIPVGGSVQLFPQGKEGDQRNLIQVVRLAAGEGAQGLVAYSAICTHLGCVVFSKLSDDGQIACPCHASKFDPAAKAAVRGGPAPRPLPALTLDVAADGTLLVASPPDGPIGVA
jgi:rieske iron-sulfur protein